MSRHNNTKNNDLSGNSRRSFISNGVLGVGGLTLAQAMKLRAATNQVKAAPDTSVIFVWLAGGPPHTETYDMKPDAPSDYRGLFSPIRTNVPGIDVCELLPMHAKCADKFTLIRSISHTFNDHGGGSKRLMTGRIPKTPTGTINDAPSVMSIVGKMREHVKVGVPNCISATRNGRSGVDTYAQGSAYLGMKYNTFPVSGDPSSSKFDVKGMFLNESLSDRLDDRKLLLGELDQLRRDADSSGAMEAMDEFNQQAYDLLTSPKMNEAFDLSKESPKLRARYGNHAWGQRALMARRMVEAGSSFVTVVMENPYVSGVKSPKLGFHNWDSHAANCDLWVDARHRFPIYDRAITALIEDLHDRALTKKVLLVVTGEFGRTPKISKSTNGPKGKRFGREHWPQAMSVLVCGGGMEHGQVVGSTNSKGEHPHDRPLTPNDLWATVYRHLGIDYHATIPDYTGRPMHLLPFGKPISELI